MIKPIRLRGKIKNGIAEVKALLPHPMETGARVDSEGALVPAHYIEEVVCQRNGEMVLRAEWGASVSKDPYFSFKLHNSTVGDKITISWTDNLGDTATGDITLA